MPHLLIPAVAVTITRDPMTILPRELPSHEVPIAQAVFGEDNVEVHEDRQLPTVTIDSDIEADRLTAKYGQESLEKAYGVNFKSGIGRAIKQASLGEAPEVRGAAADNKLFVEAAVDTVDLGAMSKDQLFAEAASRGVSVDVSLTKAKIIEAIEAAQQ